MLLKGCILIAVLAGGASAQAGCKFPETINADQGRITSPYYDFPTISPYPANAKCQFRVNVRDGQNISVAFESPFYLEGSSGNCPYDYVNVFDSNRRTDEVCRSLSVPTPGNATRLAGPFCGQAAPGPMVVPGPSAVFEFCTDSSQQYRGFALNFNATSSPAVEPVSGTPPAPTSGPIVPGSCDQTITINSTTDVVYVHSPNYPSQYPNSIVCRWTVNYPPNSVWQVNAETFDTEANFDFLRLYNGNATATPVATFSGATGPNKVRGDGNSSLTMTFTTDSSGQRPGFRLRLNIARCPAEYSTCPNNPNGDECEFTSSMMCDGKPDCPGGVDENYCNVGCGVPTVKPYLSSTDKIVYGIEARPHSWPWTVAYTGSSGSLNCGGSIIDHHFVLTAAHCCSGDSASNMFVKVGEHNLKVNQEPYAKLHALRNIIMHPRYQSRPVPAWDFCLLETKEPIMFSEDVLPVCLPSPMEPAVGTRCYIAGWGEQTPRNQSRAAVNFEKKEPSKDQKEKKESTKAISDVLRQIDVKIISQAQCQAGYPGVEISSDMICMQNYGDSCQGDSGGPVVCPAWDDHSRWELHGVVSWAYGCADPKYPGANGRVSHSIPWIADEMMKAKSARNLRSIL